MEQKYSRIISLLLVAVIMCSVFVTGCSGREKYVWPKRGLANQIDKPKSELGEISVNLDAGFVMRVYDYNEDDFSDYINACKKRGFTVDADEQTNTYEAFNKEGYKVFLIYDYDDKEMSIDITPPMKTSEIKWPNSGLGALLPVPKSSKGNIIDNNSESFYAYIDNTDKSAYKAYADDCAKKGFDKDSSSADTYYRAKDNKNHKIEIMYKGANKMSVSIDYEKKKSKTTASTSTKEKDSVLKTTTAAPKYKKKLKNLVGKTVATAKEKVKKYKFKATYYYHLPNGKIEEDYTSYVGYTSKKDLKLMYVNKVKNIDTSKRTVTIYISDKKTSSKSKKKNSLSWDTACMTAEVYGKSKYPSFSLHYIGGLISNQQYDDGSYMIKADCTYRNAYGVKIDSVCEAKVAGTDKNPKVTSFFVYD